MARFLLPALLCALIVPAQAQTALSPAPTPTVLSIDDGGALPLPAALPTEVTPSTAIAPSPRPTAPASRGAACTAFQEASNLTLDSFITTGPGSNLLGQSFTAPCDGQLSFVQIAIYRQSETAPSATQATIAVKLFEGAGGAGSRLASTVSYTLPRNPTFPSSQAYNLPLSAPVEVTQGEVYTLFYEVTAGNTQILFKNGGDDDPVVDPYTGGDLYFSSTGNFPGAGPNANLDLYFRAVFQPTTTASQSDFYNPSPAQGDGGGWRLLSAPVQGVPIRELAEQNLVQGVAAGEVGGTQYENGEDIIYVQYDGAQYFVPNTTDYTFQPGEGFFWYLFDRDVTPDPTAPAGPGTSTGQELTGFSLVASGIDNAADVTYTRPLNTADNAYMIGNPFSTPFNAEGISVTGGAIQNTLQAFDPETGSYEPIQQNNGGATDVAGVWQGFFAEVTPDASGDDIVFTFGADSKNPGATPPFYGKSGPTADLRLVLDGTLASGTPVHDRAAWVQFRDGATDGWDRYDASKLLAPTIESAAIAPVVPRDGVPTRHAVVALPADAAETVMPVQFRASGAGTFTLRADAVPQGRTAVVRDVETGAMVDLADGVLEFEAGAGGWTDRFELVVSASIVSSEGDAERVTALSAAAPNPATRRAELALTVAQPEHVRAALYDALGRQVAVLLDAEVTERATLVVDAAGLAAGVYVVRVEGETFAQTQRLSIIR